MACTTRHRMDCAEFAARAYFYIHLHIHWVLVLYYSIQNRGPLYTNTVRLGRSAPFWISVRRRLVVEVYIILYTRFFLFAYVCVLYKNGFPCQDLGSRPEISSLEVSRPNPETEPTPHFVARAQIFIRTSLSLVCLHPRYMGLVYEYTNRYTVVALDAKVAAQFINCERVHALATGANILPKRQVSRARARVEGA